MTKRKNTWEEQTVPALFPRVYLEYAREQGVDAHEVLARARLPISIADQTNPELTFLQLRDLVAATIDTLQDDSLGVDIGLRLPPTAYGNLGYALLCSETLEQAASLLIRYWNLLGRGVNVSLNTEPPQCIVDLNHVFPLPPPLEHLSYESTMASFYRGFQLLVDAQRDDMEIWFSCPPPTYADKVKQTLGNVRYNMPSNQFRFNAQLMQKRLPMHNPTGLRFAIQQCQREEALLNDEGYILREKVRQEILFGPNGYPTLEEISQRLNMSTRTLRRKLEEEGTNFKALLEEAKRRDAIQLLDDRNLEIQRVATLLGYQDPANFTRAFRQWTGQTPSQYRETRKTSGPRR